MGTAFNYVAPLAGGRDKWTSVQPQAAQMSKSEGRRGVSLLICPGVRQMSGMRGECSHRRFRIRRPGPAHRRQRTRARLAADSAPELALPATVNPSWPAGDSQPELARRRQPTRAGPPATASPAPLFSRPTSASRLTDQARWGRSAGGAAHPGGGPSGPRRRRARRRPAQAPRDDAVADLPSGAGHVEQAGRGQGPRCLTTACRETG